MHRFSGFLSNSLWALNFFWKYSKTKTILNIVLSSIVNLSQIVNALIIGVLIDRTIKLVDSGEQASQAYPLIGALVAALVILKVVQSLQEYFANYLDEVVRYYPKQVMYEKLEKLSISELEKSELNNKISRFQESIYAFKVYFDTVIKFFSEVLLLIVAVASVAAVLPEYLFISLVLVLPSLILTSINLRKLHNHRISTTEERRKVNQMANFLLETERFKEIKMSNSAKFIKGLFENFNEWSISEVFKIRRKWYFQSFIFEVLQIAVFAGVLIKLVELGIEGEISIGQIAFLYTTFTLAAANLRRVVNSVSNIKDLNDRQSDVKEVFDWVEFESDEGTKLENLNYPPSIRLQNVSFRYSDDTPPVLKNLNLEIKSGEKVAIVGHNGAGKTTLVKLISKIYPVTEGKLLIDGIDIREVNNESWYKKLGILFQTYNNYPPLTVSENIAMGDIHKPKSEEEIRQAAEMADALEFIERLPNKFEQVMSEKFKGGIRASTGQFQKLAIARFFYRNAPVLILDEPTASIDAEAEEKIFNRIYEFIENKTVIIISHRFSTVRKADRIIVLNDGEIVEEGSHAELIAKDGKYADLFTKQAKGYN